MAKKNTVKYTLEELNNLKNDKSVVYAIINKNGNTNYVGSAKRGKAIETLKEHIGEIPGVKVQIRQYSKISEAEKAANRKIIKERPRYNRKS